MTESQIYREGAKDAKGAKLQTEKSGHMPLKVEWRF
jgi:hypothetical protein